MSAIDRPSLGRRGSTTFHGPPAGASSPKQAAGGRRPGHRDARRPREDGSGGITTAGDASAQVGPAPSGERRRPQRASRGPGPPVRRAPGPAGHAGCVGHSGRVGQRVGPGRVHIGLQVRAPRRGRGAGLARGYVADALDRTRRRSPEDAPSPVIVQTAAPDGHRPMVRCAASEMPGPGGRHTTPDDPRPRRPRRRAPVGRRDDRRRRARRASSARRRRSPGSCSSAWRSSLPGAVLTGVPATLDVPTIGWLVVVGVGNVGGLVLVYAALRVGKVGIVAPITSTEGALTAVIAIVLGERIVRRGRPDPGGHRGRHRPGGRPPRRDRSRRAPRRPTRAGRCSSRSPPRRVFALGLYAAGHVSARLPPIWVVLPARLVGTLSRSPCRWPSPAGCGSPGGPLRWSSSPASARSSGR